jgi:hypothetical protein
MTSATALQLLSVNQHQIDAIADFSISPPFAYPIRLLLEAKFYQRNVGIEIVRNAVGVVKDVNEFWIASNNMSKPRFHYQYAIFTSSSFTKPAQEYAFAQDIYLIKLENNRYFYPIIESLAELNYSDFGGESETQINIDLTELRKNIRKSLSIENPCGITEYCVRQNFNREKLNNIVQSSLRLGASYLGVLGNSFPVFLTPSEFFDIDNLIADPTVRICWNSEKWYIVRQHAICQSLNESDIIFSFDLPDELFKLYSENNMLSQSRALDLKQDFMSSIQITFRDPNRKFMSSLELKLDDGWLRRFREHLD